MAEKRFKGTEPTAQPLKIPPHPKYGPPEEVYEYQGPDGAPLFYVCRFKTDKGKTFLQGRPAGSRWQWKLGTVEPVLYRLPEVHAHLSANAEHAPLYLCEGEKDVHACLEALEREGLPGTATCNPMGAGKWRDSYTEALTGARLVRVVADNDEPGRAHALMLARELGPHVGQLEPLRPALEEPKADLYDHLAAGKKLGELRPLEGTPASEPPLLFMDAYEFVQQQEESPEPYWGTEDHKLLTEGCLALLAGRPGSGKTTFVLDLACHLAAGLPYPPADPKNERAPEPYPVPRPLRIALIENEGPRELFRDKLRAKLNIFGHDIRDRGGYLGVQVWRWGGFSFADDEAFERASRELEALDIDLVIGDPLMSLGTEGVGSPRDTTDFVARLKALGLGTHRAFLLLHHFRERVEHHEDELRKLSGAWGGHLDTLIALAATGSPDQARLAFAKLRWAKAENPSPLVLGRVYRTYGFEALGHEDDHAILEPLLAEALRELRAQKGGYSGEGWVTVNNLADKVERHRKAVRLCLEGAPHLFALRTGEDAKALGAKNKTTKLYGLTEWEGGVEVQAPSAAPPAAPNKDGDIPW